ncbi:kinesin light chain 1 [Paramyrothecium foliicola]|nr:kinesin light chain 1 [Paramyrothecium foliicola]
MASLSRPQSRQSFQIAIICALPLEHAAASLAFDEFWDEDADTFGKAVGDPNTYRTGRIGSHNVVLAVLPNMGKVGAASTAASLRSSYTQLKLVVLAGICGGVPSGSVGSDEILLGDVVISKNIVQFDFGRQYPGEFEIRQSHLVQPHRNVRSFLATIEADTEELGRKLVASLAQIQMAAASRGNRAIYTDPGPDQDRLFAPTYIHRHRGETECDCDEHLVPRERLVGDRSHRVYFGTVASGDTVMKSGQERDRIARSHGAIAYEMESAGLWDELPSVMVKAVCDYADSHKNKNWQQYAAAVAAATVKSLLAYYIRIDDPVQQPKTHCLIPYTKNSDYVSRPELDQIKQLFGQTEPSKAVEHRSRVSIFGLGGTG